MEQASAQPTPGNRLQHIGEAILVIVGAYLAASLAVTVFDPLVTAAVGGSASTNAVRIVQTVLQFVTMIAVVVGYGRLVDTERLIRAVVPSPRGVGVIVGGTVVLLGGQYLINRLLEAIDLSPGANQAVLAGAGDPVYYLVMIVISLLFVGPAEELLFRGAVQGRLRESWGAWPAIVAATVLFGLIHIPAVSGGFGAQLSYALLAGVLGIVLGYLYEYTDNIVVPAVTHGCYNGTLFAVLYLGEIGYIG
ncbi:CPBP family intramembrane glutamic endopeptidase [Halohasta litorea]|uniref:CPBP family intramembrane glutamic endopeptidase n=1 Tax=Halohasta litorea TaxID=869891 RepID=A0ABD6D5Z8_9EURY|nr:CPBP family intramembrane glutamic endopeptidase [Halohasta litorea]